MSFFNTTSLPPKELKEAIANAKTQKGKILTFFKGNPNKKFTPPEVLGAIFYDTNVPLTSVRRAISDLEAGGYIVKLPEQRKGNYGKNNHLWQLRINTQV